MELKVSKLIALRKAVDWNILEQQGHDMSLVCYLSDTHAHNPLYMRAAKCLCLLLPVDSVEENPNLRVVRVIHTWDSHGLSSNDIGMELIVDVRDLYSVSLDIVTTMKPQEV